MRLLGGTNQSSYLPRIQYGYFGSEYLRSALVGFIADNGQECDQSSCVNQDGVDVRPCDIDPEILLAGCNPDCANGGTCYNGKCLCPKGITGTACNEGI